MRQGFGLTVRSAAGEVKEGERQLIMRMDQKERLSGFTQGSLSSAAVGIPGDVHTQIGSFNEAEVLCSPNWVPGGNLSGVS